MKKYLMVIARYKDWRQEFFETHMSPKNKEYCELHNFEYIEIKNDVDAIALQVEKFLCRLFLTCVLLFA